MNLRRKQLGFTMLEVLLAMGIFAIGFAMVATIFPSAILLQKRTIEDVQGQQAARNAEASILSRKFREADFIADMDTQHGAGWQTDTNVYSLPSLYFDTNPTALRRDWMLADRSYPEKRFDPRQRKFYWTVLVRDMDSNPGSDSLNSDFEFFVFVLKRRQTDLYARTLPTTLWANYYDGWYDDNSSTTADQVADLTGDTWTVPGIVRINLNGVVAPNRLEFANSDSDSDGIPDLLKENDIFLDNTGIIHTVIGADINGVETNSSFSSAGNITQIWVAPPGIDSPNQPSPTVAIFQLTETEAME